MHQVHRMAPRASMCGPVSLKYSVSRSVRETSLATRSMRSRKALLLAYCTSDTESHCNFIDSYSRRRRWVKAWSDSPRSGRYPSSSFHPSARISGWSPPRKMSSRSSASRSTANSAFTWRSHTSRVTGGPRGHSWRSTFGGQAACADFPMMSNVPSSPKRTAPFESGSDGRCDSAAPPSATGRSSAGPAATSSTSVREKDEKSSRSPSATPPAAASPSTTSVDVARRKKVVTAEAPSMIRHLTASDAGSVC
mmetsp:Transcript_13511/g.34687  ORF Transcript_13511/g.34687 Transcript_13511/m.34687 type:complete len:251 (+) Transcript_13511:793-1545(+)